MGCGASKGGSGGSGDEMKIKFDKIGVASLDGFFNQCKDVKEALEEVVEPLQEIREKLMELTGFEWIPGCSKCLSNCLNAS